MKEQEKEQMRVENKGSGDSINEISMEVDETASKRVVDGGRGVSNKSRRWRKERCINEEKSGK